MIGRVIWFGALAGVAVLATALQLDLRARAVPATATLVPEPLRNYAQTRITQDAVAGTDTKAALAEARRLVHRRPLPAEYLALLAVAQAKDGQMEAAGRTIQIAGQRGWREPVTQEAVLRLALAAGDKPEAARRYAALFLRRQTPDALLKELGPAVLAEAGGEGQATIAAIVIGAERWRTTFLRRGARVMPPAAFSAIVVRSLAQGATFNCDVLAQSIREVIQRDTVAANTLAVAGARSCPKIAPQAAPKARPPL